MIDSYLDQERITVLIRRLGLMPRLLRRDIEEEIVRIVSLPQAEIDQLISSRLQGLNLDEYLTQNKITYDDLLIQCQLDKALNLYAEYQFGPGIEEYFLSSEDERDLVVYSFIRVKSSSLALELWLRIVEDQASFSELAATYTEGHEREHKGLIGPISISSINPPEFAVQIRRLQVGEVSKPLQIGSWNILIRLESKKRAKFDDNLRKNLLHQQLNLFIQDRVRSIINSEPVPPLIYVNHK